MIIVKYFLYLIIINIIIKLNKVFLIILFVYNIRGIGDWGLGIGDWGLGPIPNPQYLFIFLYLILFEILN